MNVKNNQPIKNVTEFFTMELDYSSLKDFLSNISQVVTSQG